MFLTFNGIEAEYTDSDYLFGIFKHFLLVSSYFLDT